MNEVQRIKDVYAKRDASGARERYLASNSAARFIGEQRGKDLVEVLKESGLDALKDKRILDVGCGTGSTLRDFITYGASADKCFGIDLLPGRIEEAKALSPDIDFRCSNAEELPYDDGAFDIVILFTVFSSILDSSMRVNLASEILRVLKSGGAVVYYDYHVDNPRNKDVRGVRKSDIETLFKGCAVKLRRVTLAPPLVRAFISISTSLCKFMEKLPFLRTHYIAIIRKP